MSNGRHGTPADRAHAAKAAAADAFYAMDSTQRYLRARVDAFADLDTSEESTRLARRFSALSERADETSARYIATIDAYDLDDPRATHPTLLGAERAFTEASNQIAKVSAELDRFGTDSAPLLGRLERALDELRPRIEAANRSLVTAKDAIVQAGRGGLRTHDADGVLARAEAAMKDLADKGASGFGLTGAVAKAAEIQQLADKARDAAENLPRTAEEVRRSIASVRTRLQGVETKRDRVDEAMSQLRRKYTQRSWQDLAGADRAIGEAVTRARERLAEAGKLVQPAQQLWADAQRAVTGARAELTDADRRVSAVLDRVRQLGDVARDPKAFADKSWFALRDAQKLAVGQPGGPRDTHVRALDALVAKMEAAPDLLGGVHPDYYGYLQELARVQSAAEETVARIRAEMAGKRR